MPARSGFTAWSWKRERDRSNARFNAADLVDRPQESSCDARGGCSGIKSAAAVLPRFVAQ